MFSLVKAELTLLILLGVFVGAGRLFTRNKKETLSNHALIGMMVLGFFALFAQFFTPVTFVHTFALFTLGIWGLIEAWRSAHRNEFLALVCGSLILGLALPFWDLSYDNGLYHFQAVLWNAEEKVTLGLVHIEPRQGFNSIWTLLISLFWTGREFLYPIVSVNAILFVVFSVKVCSIQTKKPLTTMGMVGFFVLLFSFGKWVVTGGLNSPSSDLPSTFFTLLAFYAYLERRSLWFTTALAVFAVMVKTSQLPVLILPAVAWLQSKVHPKEILKCVSIFGILLAVWLFRSVLVCGCLLFPAEKTCFAAVPWVADLSVTRYIMNAVLHSARTQGTGIHHVYGPEVVNHSWIWLPYWLKLYAQSKIMLSLFFFGIVGAVFFIKTKAKRTQREFLLLWGVSLVGTLYWFMVAPDIRFGYAFVIWLFLSAFLFFAPENWQSKLSRRSPWAVALLCLGAVSMMTIASGMKRRGMGAYAEFPNVPAVQIGEQCWLAPRPCAAAIPKDLQPVQWGLWSGYKH